jgi:arylsulfatase I/J
VKEAGYDTTLLGGAAVRLIDAHDTRKPLFLYLAFTAPHTPYQAPQPYLDMYAGIADPSRRAYAAQITAMDDEIGRVVEALDKRKMRDNTLIFFVSDNGGTRSKMFAGEGAVTGELPPNNGPYRDGKGSLYEGGTRVVAIANWPGHIKPGVVDEMIHVVDMYPTFAGLAGAQLGKNKPLDGVDVWASISEGKASPREEIVYNIEPYRGGVRQGDTKLVWTSLLPPTVELFDLEGPGRDDQPCRPESRQGQAIADAYPRSLQTGCATIVPDGTGSPRTKRRAGIPGRRRTERLIRPRPGGRLKTAATAGIVRKYRPRVS